MDLNSLAILLKKKLLRDSACLCEHAHSSEASKNLNIQFYPQQDSTKFETTGAQSESHDIILKTFYFMTQSL
jgi:hypothetical protein